MNEQDFQTHVDDLFLKIEEWVELSDTALDFETQEGSLIVFLPDGGQIILSRQTTLKEIWLASPLGAYHFQYHEKEGWMNQQGEKLLPTLVKIIQAKANIILDISKI